ncbi:hypothetical protein KKG65_03900, partial [Patescibacteria group bacterium]|nr:hypothetical protein [Patescibacteria group bacterium]
TDSNILLAYCSGPWYSSFASRCSKEVYNHVRIRWINDRIFVMEIFISLLKTTRPRQWLKNLALMAALVFSGFLFVPGMFWQTVWAVMAFTMLSSGVYIFLTCSN